MTPYETLQQADRHCDMEGLPPPSALAQQLDAEWIAGRISADEVVSALIAHHQANRAGSTRP